MEKAASVALAAFSYFETAQCPPLEGLPEPAAIKGGSFRKSIGGETKVSHARNEIRHAQKRA
jgi:hypothetical protein